ncbi:hypothetical protein TNCV_3572681 [Trichonephila clavipes]|nr:hypothetical protein TNCV_3572681 [Trichonephila clavipes]
MLDPLKREFLMRYEWALSHTSSIGCPKTSCSTVSINTNPSVSTRRRSSQLVISRMTLRRILRLDLKMYAIQIVQTLLPQDHQQ